MADIGKIENLSADLVPAGAFERLRRRLDEAPKGVDFHCAQCGALRIAPFDPHFVYQYERTCREADGQPPCEKLPTPTSEKIRPAYLPGSLVYVKGLSDPRDANLPGMIEDDPYFKNEFKLMCRDTKGNEIPMAYWVTFVSATSLYRGGWIRPENLVPFKPMILAFDASSYHRSVQKQANVAFYSILANRLKVLSFVVRACFLLKNPPPEPPELGPSVRALRARLAEGDTSPERRPSQGGSARRPSSGALSGGALGSPGPVPSETGTAIGASSGQGSAHSLNLKRSTYLPDSLGGMSVLEFLELHSKNCREHGEKKALEMYPVVPPEGTTLTDLLSRDRMGGVLFDPDPRTWIPWLRDCLDGLIIPHPKGFVTGSGGPQQGSSVPRTPGSGELRITRQSSFRIYGHPAGAPASGTSEGRRPHTEDSDEDERKRRRRE